MNIKTITSNSKEIAIINSDEICISDVHSALDFIIHIHHETDTNCIIINKEAIAEDFFDLSTKIAGEILQKIINYHFRLAIVGNFLSYTSKSLNDFIYESNQGRNIFFVPTIEDAIEKLNKA